MSLNQQPPHSAPSPASASLSRSRSPSESATSSASMYAIRRWLALLVPLLTFVGAESASVLLISVAKGPDGKLLYHTSSMVLAMEALKMTATLVSCWRNQWKDIPDVLDSVRSGGVIRYAVPAGLYAINNNVFLYTLTVMSPAAFKLILSSRIVWTGFAFRWIMGRYLTPRQWQAAVVLLFACVLGQTLDESDDASYNSSMAGILLALLYCFISVAAGVYNELLLKSASSLDVANFQLYGIGVSLNVIALAYQSSGEGESLWRGWDHPITYVICFLQAFMGLAVSHMLRNQDSIVKTIANVTTNLTVYLYSAMFLGLPLTLRFAAALLLGGGASYVYTTAPGSPVAPVSSTKKSPKKELA